jgi:hypothetical protein
MYEIIVYWNMALYCGEGQEKLSKFLVMWYEIITNTEYNYISGVQF